MMPSRTSKVRFKPGKFEIALFELLDDVQRVKIVIETIAVFAHAQIELLFAGVAEGRMADVVDQRQRFGEIGIEFQSAGDGAGNLRDFEGVGEAIAEMIGIARGENLRLGFQAAKRAGVNYAIAVAGVVVAVRMLRLGVAAAARTPHVHGVGGEHLQFDSSASRRSPPFSGAEACSRKDCCYHSRMLSEAAILRKLTAICLRLPAATEGVTFGHPRFASKEKCLPCSKEYKDELGIW